MDEVFGKDTLERHGAVHVEEVGGEHGRCLSAQELAPRRVSVPDGRGRDPPGLEHPADRGRAYPVAELEHLTLDPLVSPAAILGGEPFDERADLSADGRASGPVRIGPLPADKAPVPPKRGPGRD
jgi:hypothetical protein